MFDISLAKTDNCELHNVIFHIYNGINRFI